MNDRVSTGIAGLDEILAGGLIRAQSYLIRGASGSGKTTLGQHVLASGVDGHLVGLFISLTETESQLRVHAAQQGLDSPEVHYLDLSPTSDFFSTAQTYDIFSPAEVEREPTTRRIIESVQSLRPALVFVDSMSHFRYLSTDQWQFRGQVTAFVRFILESGATLLFTSESTDAASDDDLKFIADGIIDLGFEAGERFITVSKCRGSGMSGGRHSMSLGSEGMRVFPRLVPGDYSREFEPTLLPSGVPEFDVMLNGGIERGTITVITGPSGIGKTTLGMQFMKEAAERGERSAAYVFEEWTGTLLARCDRIGLPARQMLERGTLAVTQIEPLQLTPDEFSSMVKREVDENDTRLVMIDSIAGYRVGLRGRELVTYLHALSKYLQNMGVAVILVNELEAITGEFRVTELGVSYLADNIVFLRYLESGGAMHRTIGVLKKRVSDFEKTLREFEISSSGVRIGRPLTEMRGLLTGVPESVARPAPEAEER
jgi:circadian clock protein KaiC